MTQSLSNPCHTFKQVEEQFQLIADNKTETPKPCMIQTNNKVEDNPCKGCIHYVYGYCRGEVKDED